MDKNYSLEDNYKNIKKISITKFKKIQTSDINVISIYLFYITNTKLDINLMEIFDFVIGYSEYVENKLNKIFDFLSSKSKTDGRAPL